ncbi:hypothetical protein [Streptomyces sp. NPDC015131]|uniref:hypothetical protein n=1 Tax=Streptomyces sp. NPDC015131 TaxID=3364941 RepID=UPI0036FD1D4C
MNGITWLILLCASTCSMTSLLASSARTGMSRLDARELHRRLLLIRVLRSNSSQRFALRPRGREDGTDALDPTGDTGTVEWHPPTGPPHPVEK